LDIERILPSNLISDHKLDYVSFSLDTNKLFVHDSFNIMFYSLASYGDGRISIDITDWITIPNDMFNVFTTPSNITLKQGDSRVIGMHWPQVAAETHAL
jgi:hypothetical protein